MKRAWLVLLFPLLIVAIAWAMVKFIWAVVFSPEHAWRLAISLDQLANTAFNGHEDETISSRAGRHCDEAAPQDRECWACWLCRLLDHLDPDHCRKSRGV